MFEALFRQNDTNMSVELSLLQIRIEDGQITL